MADQDPKPARVAIKFGKSSSSSTNGAKTKGHARRNNGAHGGRRYRAHAQRDGPGSESESGSGSDDENDGRNKRAGEAITGYGPNGASHDDHVDDHDRRRFSGRGKDGSGSRDEAEEDREERRRRRRRSESPSDSQDGARGRRGTDERAAGDGQRENKDSTGQDKPAKYGLTINKKRDRSSEEGAKPAASADKHAPAPAPAPAPEQEKEIEKKPIGTADEEALDALLGKSEEARRKRKYSASSTDPVREPRAEDYRSLPVENFGEALLRGYGWDGKPRGKVKEVVRRHANLTGLGARGIKGAEDLGAWDVKSGAGGRKEARRPRLSEYHAEEEKKKRRMEERRGESSYKRERDRERERERDRR